MVFFRSLIFIACDVINLFPMKHWRIVLVIFVFLVSNLHNLKVAVDPLQFFRLFLVKSGLFISPLVPVSLSPLLCIFFVVGLEYVILLWSFIILLFLFLIQEHQNWVLVQVTRVILLSPSCVSYHHLHWLLICWLKHYLEVMSIKKRVFFSYAHHVWHFKQIFAFFVWKSHHFLFLGLFCNLRWGLST